MRKTVQINVDPQSREDTKSVILKALKKAGLDPKTGRGHILRRSLDARQRNAYYVFQVEVWDADDPAPEAPDVPSYQMVDEARPAFIIGAGPAGYFAALELLTLGIKPILFERGKDVQSRRRDLKAIQQFSVVDPNSNYCFGEGGAGTYSDGKLYTRATKRGNVRSVLETLVAHGAGQDILIDAHPHIGSNKLPTIIEAIRATILSHGGEVHFESRVTDILVKSDKIAGVVVNDEKEYKCDNVILATGHSARDIYALLASKDILLELKPFALGVRIEHPQPLIDSIQYKRQNRGDDLPPASYRLACNVDNRGVFSFCMCPGGLVVPSATAPGEIVVNGMSLSRRDSPYANAGTVVSVDEKLVEKITGENDALAGIAFQREIEQLCFKAGDGSQAAPAQRLVDFMKGKSSKSLPSSSYIPGLFAHDVGSLLPSEITHALKHGVRQFGKRMKGYLTNEAVVIATESRTSSPVRIPRDGETLMHPQVEGLFPSGEGAGFAGGIVSAAVDGMRVAHSLAEYLKAQVQ
ncbi:MAG: FAD-binding protein [Bacteroidetes bacterium]|nr:MAG: FAD-binding protein [Bacteroidota bacterium]